MTRFTYTTSKKGKVKLFHLSGDLIDRDAPDSMLKETIADIVKGTNTFILDMEKLNYMNSVGLTIIINLIAKSRQGGGDVSVCNVNGKISKLFEITKLNTMFNVCKTIDKSLALLRKREE